MQPPIRIAVAALLASLTFGCRHRGAFEGGTLYTQTNLHPDEMQGRLYSVNYQRAGLIPLCTPVRMDRVSGREARFTVLSTQRSYRYIFHRSMREPVESHLRLYFGPACPTLQGQSAADVAGVQRGRVFQGMTKQGVILAIGYPPAHGTPSLDSDVWKYWESRFDTFEVHFANGVVVGIRD